MFGGHPRSIFESFFKEDLAQFQHIENKTLWFLQVPKVFFGSAAFSSFKRENGVRRSVGRVLAAAVFSRLQQVLAENPRRAAVEKGGEEQAKKKLSK